MHTNEQVKIKHTRIKHVFRHHQPHCNIAGFICTEFNGKMCKKKYRTIILLDKETLIYLDLEIIFKNADFFLLILKLVQASMQPPSEEMRWGC